MVSGTGGRRRWVRGPISRRAQTVSIASGRSRLPTSCLASVASPSRGASSAPTRRRATLRTTSPDPSAWTSTPTPGIYAPDGPSAVTVPADDCGAGSDDAFIAAFDARRAAGDLSRAWPTLSDRERAVLTLLCDGLTLDEIAGHLGVARSTVCRALRAAKDRLTRAMPTRRRAA